MIEAIDALEMSHFNNVKIKTRKERYEDISEIETTFKKNANIKFPNVYIQKKRIDLIWVVHPFDLLIMLFMNSIYLLTKYHNRHDEPYYRHHYSVSLRMNKSPTVTKCICFTFVYLMQKEYMPIFLVFKKFYKSLSIRKISKSTLQILLTDTRKQWRE